MSNKREFVGFTPLNDLSTAIDRHLVHPTMVQKHLQVMPSQCLASFPRAVIKTEIFLIQVPIESSSLPSLFNVA
jgi:hypothetical protein